MHAMQLDISNPLHLKYIILIFHNIQPVPMYSEPPSSFVQLMFLDI